MTINRGDFITAAALNTINGSIVTTYAEGHTGHNPWATKNYYFYSNKPANSVLVRYDSHRTPGNEHEVRLYRYENGSWVQKDYDHNGWGAIKGDYKGAGPGMYRCYLHYHNNTPTTKIYPVKNNNVRGNFLVMMDRGPTRLTESELLSMNPRCHNTIYASDINAGRVYTD